MATSTSEKLFTWEEVAQHNSVSNGVWVVIDGCVYDVTQFLNEHPGGEEVLLDNAGKDATNAFRDVGHSQDAIQLREGFLIGRITSEPLPPGQSKQVTSPVKAAAGVAAGLLVPALVATAVVIGAILIYRHYKK